MKSRDPGQILCHFLAVILRKQLSLLNPFSQKKKIGMVMTKLLGNHEDKTEYIYIYIYNSIIYTIKCL